MNTLGKSIKDPPKKGTNFANLHNELSFFESLLPILSSWNRAIVRCNKNIKLSLEKINEWNDLVFMKLLADGLDWPANKMVFFK